MGIERKKLRPDGTPDCRVTDEIVCPYCGYEFHDSWDYPSYGSMECYECSKEFNFSRNESVTYSTTRRD